MEKKTRRCAILASAMLALACVPALGASQDFTLHNHTERVMKSLAVSPTGEDRWSKDILGQDILDEHTDLEVKFPRPSDDCKWDVRAEFADGSTAQLSDVDFCAVTDVTFTR